MKTQSGANDVAALRRRLREAHWAVLSLVVILTAVLIPEISRMVKENAMDLGITHINRKAPQAEAIRKLVKPLSYSGIPILMRKDFRLSINVPDKTWTAHNIHRFDERGNILLEQGRYGLCGDLATYLYDPVRALFDDSYSVKLMRVSQSQFFPAPISSHYVLRIAKEDEEKPDSVFILDPSLSRYGPLEDFEDYLFFDPRDRLEYARKRNPDETFFLGQGTPLLLHARVQVGLVIGPEGRQFDATHYRLTLGATRPYRYTARTLLMIRRRGDRVDVLDRKEMSESLLSKSVYRPLRDRVLELFRGISVADRPSG